MTFSPESGEILIPEGDVVVPPKFYCIECAGTVHRTVTYAAGDADLECVACGSNHIEESAESALLERVRFSVMTSDYASHSEQLLAEIDALKRERDEAMAILPACCGGLVAAVRELNAQLDDALRGKS